MKTTIVILSAIVVLVVGAMAITIYAIYRSLVGYVRYTSETKKQDRKQLSRHGVSYRGQIVRMDRVTEYQNHYH